MRVLRIISKDTYVQAIREAAQVLEKGGVVMHPTDTCYGLAANIFNENALIKLYEIKQMSGEKPVNVMVDSVDRALEYGNFDELSLKFIREFCPGPFALIVPRAELLPAHVNPGARGIGIRFPDHELCHDLVEVCGVPLTTTSANLSGHKEVNSVLEYIEQVKDKTVLPDLVLDVLHYKPRMASTIIDFTSTPPNVLREGSQVQIANNFLRENLNN